MIKYSVSNEDYRRMLCAPRVLLFRLLSFMVTLGSMQLAVAETPLRVLTSIKPLQLIALDVGGDAIRAEVLLDPRFSPHDYQLRPSDRLKLNAADVVFWVGPQLEAFLRQPIKSLPKQTTVVSFQDADEDPHVWMDPIVTIGVARRMAVVFSTLQPERRAYFEANSERLASALLQQDLVHREQLKQFPNLHGFMVSHDAYSRFERRYGFAHRAALTNAADMPPSAKSMLNIERELADGRIACIWRQPQEGKLYERLVAGKNIRAVTIDAMAAEIPNASGGVELFYQRLWQAVILCVAS